MPHWAVPQLTLTVVGVADSTCNPDMESVSKGSTSNEPNWKCTLCPDHPNYPAQKWLDHMNVHAQAIGKTGNTQSPGGNPNRKFGASDYIRIYLHYYMALEQRKPELCKSVREILSKFHKLVDWKQANAAKMTEKIDGWTISLTSSLMCLRAYGSASEPSSSARASSPKPSTSAGPKKPGSCISDDSFERDLMEQKDPVVDSFNAELGGSGENFRNLLATEEVWAGNSPVDKSSPLLPVTAPEAAHQQPVTVDVIVNEIPVPASEIPLPVSEIPLPTVTEGDESMSLEFLEMATGSPKGVDDENAGLQVQNAVTRADYTDGNEEAVLVFVGANSAGPHTGNEGPIIDYVDEDKQMLSTVDKLHNADLEWREWQKERQHFDSIPDTRDGMMCVGTESRIPNDDTHSEYVTRDANCDGPGDTLAAHLENAQTVENGAVVSSEGVQRARVGKHWKRGFTGGKKRGMKKKKDRFRLRLPLGNHRRKTKRSLRMRKKNGLPKAKKDTAIEKNLENAMPDFAALVNMDDNLVLLNDNEEEIELVSAVDDEHDRIFHVDKEMLRAYYNQLAGVFDCFHCNFQTTNEVKMSCHATHHMMTAIQSGSWLMEVQEEPEKLPLRQYKEAELDAETDSEEEYIKAPTPPPPPSITPNSTPKKRGRPRKYPLPSGSGTSGSQSGAGAVSKSAGSAAIKTASGGSRSTSVPRALFTRVDFSSPSRASGSNSKPGVSLEGSHLRAETSGKREFPRAASASVDLKFVQKCARFSKTKTDVESSSDSEDEVCTPAFQKRLTSDRFLDGLGYFPREQKESVGNSVRKYDDVDSIAGESRQSSRLKWKKDPSNHSGTGGSSRSEMRSADAADGGSKPAAVPTAFRSILKSSMQSRFADRSKTMLPSTNMRRVTLDVDSDEAQSEGEETKKGSRKRKTGGGSASGAKRAEPWAKKAKDMKVNYHCSGYAIYAGHINRTATRVPPGTARVKKASDQWNAMTLEEKQHWNQKAEARMQIVHRVTKQREIGGFWNQIPISVRKSIVEEAQKIAEESDQNGENVSDSGDYQLTGYQLFAKHFTTMKADGKPGNVKTVWNTFSYKQQHHWETEAAERVNAVWKIMQDQRCNVPFHQLRRLVKRHILLTVDACFQAGIRFCTVKPGLEEDASCGSTEESSDDDNDDLPVMAKDIKVEPV